MNIPTITCVHSSLACLKEDVLINRIIDITDWSLVGLGNYKMVLWKIATKLINKRD